jgi:ABC-type antimicrobial peptide transport system permease subunit
VLAPGAHIPTPPRWRREFAIRLALGRPRVRVVRMVFRQSTMLVAVGLCIGLAVAKCIVQVLAAAFPVFYGLRATRVPTLLNAVALSGLIGTTAAVVPASQAVRGGWRRALNDE